MTHYRYLTVAEVILIHDRVIQQSGGSAGLRDRGALEASVYQPQQTFGGADLYPTHIEKAAALAYGLVKNHPFIDGNKRIGHAAMEVFLMLNGFEVASSVDEQESMFLDLARGHGRMINSLPGLETA
ncbi:type II toxin-antitoxin system death-on-curing family toxin [soil metagenome]